MTSPMSALLVALLLGGVATDAARMKFDNRAAMAARMKTEKASTNSSRAVTHEERGECPPLVKFLTSKKDCVDSGSSQVVPSNCCDELRTCVTNLDATSKTLTAQMGKYVTTCKVQESDWDGAADGAMHLRDPTLLCSDACQQFPEDEAVLDVDLGELPDKCETLTPEKLKQVQITAAILNTLEKAWMVCNAEDAATTTPEPSPVDLVNTGEQTWFLVQKNKVVHAGKSASAVPAHATDATTGWTHMQGASRTVINTKHAGFGHQAVKLELTPSFSYGGSYDGQPGQFVKDAQLIAKPYADWVGSHWLNARVVKTESRNVGTVAYPIAALSLTVDLEWGNKLLLWKFEKWTRRVKLTFRGDGQKVRLSYFK